MANIQIDECPDLSTVVSVGSTPTAHFSENLQGVTEVRAGVYTFFDLVMAGIGVCTPEQIALSVVTRVIGHNHHKNWLFIDAGGDVVITGSRHEFTG